MPDGFVHSSGDYRQDWGIPSSAFSKGDLLMLTSTSSLSRVNPYAIAAGAEVYGVALSSSLQSIDNKVPVIRPLPETIFRVRAVAGSTVTKGATSGVSFIAAGRYQQESGGTGVIGIVAGVAECDQSVESHVLATIVVSGGLVDTL